VLVEGHAIVEEGGIGVVYGLEVIEPLLSHKIIVSPLFIILD
jgi:hypothetical protein